MLDGIPVRTGEPEIALYNVTPHVRAAPSKIRLDSSLTWEREMSPPVHINHTSLVLVRVFAIPCFA